MHPCAWSRVYVRISVAVKVMLDQKIWSERDISAVLLLTTRLTVRTCCWTSDLHVCPTDVCVTLCYGTPTDVLLAKAAKVASQSSFKLARFSMSNVRMLVAIQSSGYSHW